MHSPVQNVFRRVLTGVTFNTRIQCRSASLTGAIGRGIRKGQSAASRNGDRQKRSFDRQDNRSRDDLGTDGRTYKRPGRGDRQNVSAHRAIVKRIGQGTNPQSRWRSRNTESNRESMDIEEQEEYWGSRKARDPKGETKEHSSNTASKYSTTPPLSIPYTTAGSEFLYGTFAVEAAIRAQRRKLYKLYVYHSQNPEEKAKSQISGLRKRAMAAGVKIVDVAGAWMTILNKMSSNRPHNGVVLEASSLPKLPVTALQRLDEPNDRLVVNIGHQSSEERAVNNIYAMSGDEAYLPSIRPADRYPFLLLLDCIVDPENVGAICRSAYYLGVDAILIPRHGTAPFSGITVKASAGAAEHISILQVNNEVNFIKSSKQNGWKFFAAVAPDSGLITSHTMNPAKQNAIVRNTLLRAPTVLMLGSESTGLRPYLERLADGAATIVGARGKSDGVDSLNVSVAAALLIREFLESSSVAEKPPSSPGPSDSSATLF